MRHPQLTILSLVILFLLVVNASAHGFISWPRPRGLLGLNNYGLKPLFPEAPVDFCPHCQNGGGAASVKEHNSDGKWTPYEPTIPSFPFRNDHGLCGDPKGTDDHMATGQYYTGLTLATYEQGDYIDFEAHVSAHHNGYFEFFACSLDCCGQDDLSQRCFVNKCCEKLMRVRHKSCESGHDRVCGPVYPRHPGRWYLPPRDEENPASNWYGGLNKKMRYALPIGMTCERCLIHWAWTTANSCNPPGYADYMFPSRWQGIPGDGGSVGGINRSLGTCGAEGVAFPEEFWSCSENIRIVRKNGGKDRSVQTFHNGDMEIEGPDDSTSSEFMKPTKEPIMVPVAGEPVMTPGVEEPVTTPAMEEPVTTPVVEELQKEAPSLSPTPTPNLGPVPEHRMSVSENGTDVVVEPVEASSYQLSNYVKSYDTGACLTRDESQYCQACLDLGCGVTKCFWCTRDSYGAEKCLHQRP